MVWFGYGLAPLASNRKPIQPHTEKEYKCLIKKKTLDDDGHDDDDDYYL